MTYNFVPYGRDRDGKYGTLLDDTTGSPLASSIEILSELPEENNFPGRVVFSLGNKKIYFYNGSQYEPIEGQGVFTSEEENREQAVEGSIYWDGQALYVRLGGMWVPVTGSNLGTLIQESVYTIELGKTSYNIGSSSNVFASVEVFIDGVRQIPNEDYIQQANVITLKNIDFSDGSSFVGSKLIIRSFSSNGALPNTRIIERNYIVNNDANGNLIRRYNIGQPEVKEESIMVFRNGSIVNSSNYSLSQEDKLVTGIRKIVNNQVQIQLSSSEHNFSAGGIIRLIGSLPPGNRFIFYINKDLNIVDVNNNVISVSPLLNDNISANTTEIFQSDITDLYFIPNTISDYIVFDPNFNLTIDDEIHIRSFKNIINEVSERINKIKEGFIDHNSFSGGTYHIPVGGITYLGVCVKGTEGNVTINIQNIAGESGRKITIKDEGGNPDQRNIIIRDLGDGGRNIDGNGNYTIDTERESVTLLYRGEKWHVVSSYKDN